MLIFKSKTKHPFPRVDFFLKVLYSLFTKASSPNIILHHSYFYRTAAGNYLFCTHNFWTIVGKTCATSFPAASSTYSRISYLLRSQLLPLRRALLLPRIPALIRKCVWFSSPTLSSFYSAEGRSLQWSSALSTTRFRFVTTVIIRPW